MKRIIFFTFMLCVMFAQASYAVETAKVSPKKITLVADDWCPYTCDDTKTPGFLTEVATEVFNKAGYQVEYKLLPWNRCLEDVKNGRYNGIIGVTRVEGKDLYIDKSNQLGVTIFKFFTRKDSKWKYTSLKSLEEVTFGAIEGYDMSEELNDYVKNNKSNPDKIQLLSSVNGVDSNLKKLVNGRIDALFEDRYVVSYYAKQYGMADKIRDAGTSIKMEKIADEYMYIGFAPKDPNSKKYAKILSDGINEFRKNGRLKIILDKYNVTDWNDITKNAEKFKN